MKISLHAGSSSIQYIPVVYSSAPTAAKVSDGIPVRGAADTAGLQTHNESVPLNDYDTCAVYHSWYLSVGKPPAARNTLWLREQRRRSSGAQVMGLGFREEDRRFPSKRQA